MHRSRKRIARFTGVLGALALVAAACGPADDEAVDGPEDEPAEALPEIPEEGVFEDSLDYGLIYDQTGPTTDTQVPFANGVRAALEAANRDGGIHGREINIIDEDEEYDAAVGAAAFERLVHDRPVVGMTALNNSAFADTVIEDVDPSGVPVVGAQATIRTSVNPMRENFFALQCPYPDQIDVHLSYLMAQVDDYEPSVVTFVGDVASGHEYGELTEARVEQAGGEYLGHFAVPYDAADADAQAREIEELDPDIIVMHGGVGTAIASLRSLETFGVTDTPVGAIFAQKNPAIMEAVPALADVYSAVHCYRAADDPDVDDDMRDQMISDAEEIGVDEDMYMTSDFADGYVSGLVAVEGLERAGENLSRESFREALEGIENFETGGLAPPITFGPDDRIGVETVIPFVWDQEQETFVSEGSFADFEDCVVHEYVTESIEDWDPRCYTP